MNRLSRFGVTSLALVMVLAAMPPSAAAQIQIFSTGGYVVPETISLAPGGFGTFGGSHYFIPDAVLRQIWVVPITGGPPSVFPIPPLAGSVPIGGLFLPPGWGDNSGKFLLAAGVLRVYDSTGNMTVFDPQLGNLTMPVIARDEFTPYGGNLFVTEQGGVIWRAAPAGGGLSLFKDFRGETTLLEPWGIECTPPDFDPVNGNRLLVSDGVVTVDNGPNKRWSNIVALDAAGAETPFATILLKDGQDGVQGQDGLRQMLVTPNDYFLDSLGFPGRFLLVSVSGSGGGGGALGELLALNPSGEVKAHLVVGTVRDKFDPRGMVFTGDGHLLVSDASDPILIASAVDFVPGRQDVPALSPAHLWIGLKNSDDQGTQFDVQAELLKNGTALASGLQRCVTGVTRNPAVGKEAVIAFSPFADVPLASGDVLALRVSARIGTNPDGSKCAGPGGSHNSTAGLRLYYDSAGRPSRFGATIIPNPNADFYLHSDGSPCPNGDGQSPGVTARTLDTIKPAAGSPKCKDSGVLNFTGGNPFSVIGTWSLAPLP